MPQTHEIDNDHPVRLPQDVVGLIATVVASDTDEERRINTLVNCIPVCRSFAHEFCPHLFKTFCISDCLVKGAEVVGKRLFTHAQALEDHPEYRAMIKAVTIRLGNGSGCGRSVGNDPQFPSWLNLRRFNQAPGALSRNCALDHQFDASPSMKSEICQHES
ncbi:hypothetical protein BKA70DRAFT_735228 [Coprinopsis sp. MPI-PUGE-AT-0042]|nr:hypothetical protein BKA70DRAFT_735228 [Coprinopsis sp. MPI-PUGE-AT-0042]